MLGFPSDAAVPIRRGSYADHVRAVGAQLLDDSPSTANHALASGLARVQSSESLDFGHEALALLRQRALLEAGAAAGTVSTLRIPLLEPPRRLRKALELSLCGTARCSRVPAPRGPFPDQRRGNSLF